MASLLGPLAKQPSVHVLDQRMGDLAGMHGIAQHVQARFACAGAAVFVDGFDDAAQQLAGMGQGVGRVHVGLDGEEWGSDGFTAVWVRYDLFHDVIPIFSKWELPLESFSQIVGGSRTQGEKTEEKTAKTRPSRSPPTYGNHYGAAVLSVGFLTPGRLSDPKTLSLRHFPDNSDTSAALVG
jgi:hypothetical protein